MCWLLAVRGWRTRPTHVAGQRSRRRETFDEMQFPKAAGEIEIEWGREWAARVVYTLFSPCGILYIYIYINKTVSPIYSKPNLYRHRQHQLQRQQQPIGYSQRRKRRQEVERSKRTKKCIHSKSFRLTRQEWDHLVFDTFHTRFLIIRSNFPWRLLDSISLLLFSLLLLSFFALNK